MPRTPQDITDAELAVLQSLWDDGPATIRSLTDALYPGGGSSHYATVQKLLERLEIKECVGRERRPGGHVFSAVLARDELIGRRLRTMAEKLCGGSLAPLLTSLVQTTRLNARERQELRDLLEHLDKQRESNHR